MLATYTSSELTELIAYYSIYPFPEDRQDINAALICSTIANANRDKNTPAYKINDFLIDYEARFKEAQTQADRAEQIKSAMASLRAIQQKAK